MSQYGFIVNGQIDLSRLPEGFRYAVKVKIARDKVRTEVVNFFNNLLVKPSVGKVFHIPSLARALAKYADVEFDRARSTILSAFNRKRFSNVYKEIDVFDPTGSKLGGRWYAKVAEVMSQEEVADIVDTDAILDDLDLLETHQESDISDVAIDLLHHTVNGADQAAA